MEDQERTRWIIIFNPKRKELSKKKLKKNHIKSLWDDPMPQKKKIIHKILSIMSIFNLKNQILFKNKKKNAKNFKHSCEHASKPPNIQRIIIILIIHEQFG